jgi:O-antigen/teichoic acid export membrane protein
MENLKNKVIAFLRWSEKYTKTDMVYITSNTFWLQIAKGGSLLLSLASSIVFANFLLPETYGNFRYILSIFSYLTISTLAGMDSAIINAAAKEQNKAIILSVKEKIKWGFGGLVVGLGIAIYYLLNKNTELFGVVLIASLFVPFFDPLFSFMYVLNGRKNFKLSTKYGLIIRLEATLALIATVFISKNIIIIMLVYFLSNFIPRLIFFRKIFDPIKSEKDDYTDEEAKKQILFGKHLSFMGIMGQISVYLDQILVFHFNNAAVLAGYYLSMVPFRQVQSLASTINTLAQPKFSQNSMENIKKNLIGKIVKMYVIIIPILILYFLLASLIFQKIYPKYLDYIFLSKIFMLQLLYFPLGLLGTAFLAHGKQKELYIGTVYYSTVRIILILVLTPMFGIYGAAAAILTVGATNGLLNLYLFLKK